MTAAVTDKSYDEARFGIPFPIEHRDEQIRRIKKHGSWFGTMTIWNAKAIHRRLQRMLAGKRYTFASVNTHFHPEDSLTVRTGQRLGGSISNMPEGDYSHCSLTIDDSSAHIIVCDTYGIWGIQTYTQSGDTKDFLNPYLVFEHCRSGEQLKIVRRAGAGHVLTWKICVEGDL